MALASSTGISTIPIPVGWTVSYGCIIILCCRSWQNDFSNGRSQIIAWIAISRLEKSRRTTSDGSLQAQTYMLVQTLEKMQADIHKMYDEIIETGQIKEKESPVDGEAYTDIEELQHDYLAMIKAVVDMLDGAKYLWQK